MIGGWFIAMFLTLNGVPAPDSLSLKIAQGRDYGSQQGCMADANALARGLRARTFHGTYLCMRHGESVEVLRARRHVDF